MPFELPLEEPFDDPLELELELPGRRGAVNALPQRHEGNPEGVQVFDQDNEVPEIPAKAIQSPTDHDVKPSPSSIGHELIEGVASILRSAHTAIYVLNPGPSSSLDVPAEFIKLVLWLLIDRRDSGIDRRSHTAV